jgi:hypothetical protein
LRRARRRCFTPTHYEKLTLELEGQSDFTHSDVSETHYLVLSVVGSSPGLGSSAFADPRLGGARNADFTYKVEMAHLAPTPAPTPAPTAAPSVQPAPAPSVTPSLEPSPLPTLAPTLLPEVIRKQNQKLHVTIKMPQIVTWNFKRRAEVF